MKIAILTTETVHHLFYVRELSAFIDNVLVIAESRSVGTSQPLHSFEIDRDIFERQIWFDGGKVVLEDFANTFRCEDVNDEKAVTALQNFQPDLIIVFGTGLIQEYLIHAYSGRIFNLHGGNPEYYRGLDSHLWAIKNRDWANLATCIHQVDAELDTGDIVQLLPLPLDKVSSLEQLRSVNTDVCISLSRNLLEMFQSGTLKTYAQSTRGNYYSTFPNKMKDECINIFAKHIQELAFEA